MGVVAVGSAHELAVSFRALWYLSVSNITASKIAQREFQPAEVQELYAMWLQKMVEWSQAIEPSLLSLAKLVGALKVIYSASKVVELNNVYPYHLDATFSTQEEIVEEMCKSVSENVFSAASRQPVPLSSIATKMLMTDLSEEYLGLLSRQEPAGDHYNEAIINLLGDYLSVAEQVANKIPEQ